LCPSIFREIWRHCNGPRLLCPINATSSSSYVFRLQYPRALHCRIVPIEKLKTLVALERKKPPITLAVAQCFWAEKRWAEKRWAEKRLSGREAVSHCNLQWRLISRNIEGHDIEDKIHCTVLHLYKWPLKSTTSMWVGIIRRRF
jgi:hypothetical protein